MKLIRSCLIIGLVLVCGILAPAQIDAPLPHVEVRGSGPTHVVLLACGGCDWRSWEPFMERNTSHYTMYAVTLPGMAGTRLPPNIPNVGETPLLDMYAASVSAYIRERKLKHVVLIGHSVGAAVGLKSVLNHPGLIDKLFLVDWGAIHPAGVALSPEQRRQRAEKERAERLAMSDAEFRERLAQMVPAVIANSARRPAYLEMFRTANRVTAAQGGYEMGVYDLRPALHTIGTPLAAVFGLPSAEVSEAKRWEAQEVLKGARNIQFVFFETTGHWVMEDRPLEFDRIVADFVSGRPIRGAVKKAGR